MLCIIEVCATSHVARRRDQGACPALMRIVDANISASSVSPITDFDPSRIQEEILQNEELVKRILESAENCSTQ